MNSLLNGIRFFRPTICSHFHMIHMMPTTITPSKVLPGTYNQRLRTNNPTKTSWPELVGVEGTYNQCLRTNKPTDTIWSELIGLTAEEAKRKIMRPGAKVVPQGSHITFDYKPGRVRLFVDESNKVVRIKKG